MIRAILLAVVVAYLAFSYGRVYESQQNREAISTHQEIQRIAFMLEQLPTNRGRK